MLEGLKNDEKCAYILDESTKGEIVQAFRRSNVRIKKYTYSKQLEFLTRKDTYLKDGHFDPDRTIELLKRMEKAAIRDGYKGLRILGEMGWALRKPPGAEKLVEYEAKVNHLFLRSKSAAICLYDENKFAPEILLDMIHIHPKIALRSSVCENPHHLSPDYFIARKRGEITRKIYERVRDDLIDRSRSEMELRLAAEEVRKSEEKYRAMVNSSPDSIYLLDRNLRYLTLNDELLSRLGLSRDEVIGKSFAEFHPPDETRELAGRVEKVFVTGRPVRHEHWSERLGKFFLRTLSPVKDPETGEVTAAIVVSKDITELKQTEEKLRRSEEKLRTIVANTPVVLFMLDNNGIFTLSEGRGLEALGLKPGEVVGQSVFEVYRDFPQIQENVRRALAGEAFGTVVDVSGLVFDTRYFPVRDEDGKVIGVVGVATDITEHTLTVKALQESENKLRGIFSAMPDGITVVGLDGKILTCNDAVLRMHGVSRDEYVGKNVYDFISPEDRQRAIQKGPETLKRGHFCSEVKAIKKGGGTFDAEINVTLLKNSEGKPTAFLGVTRDITERKRIENALRESENKYRTIFETASAATVIIEEDMTISLVNKEFEKLSGYSKEEVEGKKSWTEFVVKEDLQKMKEYHKLRREEPGLAPKNYEFRFVDKTGNIKDIFLSVDIILGTKRSVASLLDISERKKAEERMREFIYKVNALSRGECYFHSSRDAAYRIFSNLVLHGIPGLCISREKPDTLLGYGVPREKIVLISSTPVKGFETIEGLQEVSIRISNFLKDNKNSVVLLDALTYLISRLDFDSVYKFLQEKRFNFLETGATLIIPINLAVFSDKERALLSSEIKILG